jgi:hypothetical protein
MSKFTIGTVAAGVMLASAIAVSVAAGLGNGDESHDTAPQAKTGIGTITSETFGGSAGEASAQTASDKAATAAKAAQAAAQQKAAGKVKASAAKAVRSVKLQLPITATNVGANVTGLIIVADTAAKVSTPVEAAAVALQQLRGKEYVTVSDGLTDESGFFHVAFTSKTNGKWRAELTSSTGKKTYSAPVVTKASALVTWASRPDMDLVHGEAATYSFRVNTETPSATGHLEIANSKTPTKWVPLKNIPVSATGVVVQEQKFPTAGTWLLRGATAGNSTNAPGYTTSLTITVG